MEVSNMTNQRLHLIIVCDDDNFFLWIAATIKMSNLQIETINQASVDAISKIKKINGVDQLLIIEGSAYSKYCEKIIRTFSSIEHEFPLLVVTETYEKTESKNHAFSIIDTIVKPSLSIHSLEHAISSLLKDYKLTERLKRLAHYDALTGAANRYLFDDRFTELIKKTKRDKQHFSLLFFDLNGFKLINDQYGHEVGDRFLQHFVSLLNKIKRETDTLARLGGDEFCMLLPNTQKENLLQLVERIKAILLTPLIHSNKKLYIKTAIGGVNIVDQNTSLFNPQDILKIADKCVYKAKEQAETHLILEIIE